ncbi:MAG: hypothetical protein ACRCWR_03985, partial [Saezia sp.]
MHITPKTTSTPNPGFILLLGLLLSLLSLTHSAVALSCAPPQKITSEDQIANWKKSPSLYLAKLIHVKREQAPDQNSNKGDG